MPMSKTKLKNAAIAAKSAALLKLPTELLDQFVTARLGIWPATPVVNPWRPP